MSNDPNEMELDTVYVYSDDTVCVSPDGIGRYFYDTIEEAQEDTGAEKIIYLDIVYNAMLNLGIDEAPERSDDW